MPLPIPAIIGLVGAVAPALIDYLAGPRAGTVAQKVADAAQEIFSTSDSSAIEAAIAQDPKLAATFRTRVLEIAADERKAELAAEDARRKHEMDMLATVAADITNARAQMLALSARGSILSWGAAIVSVVISAGYFLILYQIVSSSDPLDREAKMLMIGGLVTAFAAVVAYWVGSSMGSASKNEQVERMAARVIATGARPAISEADRLNQEQLDRARGR